MRSCLMPNFTHQMESFDSPPAPRLANGVQLSVRILSGNPYASLQCNCPGSCFDGTSCVSHWPLRRINHHLKFDSGYVAVVVVNDESYPQQRRLRIGESCNILLGGGLALKS
jgi:hypothetical protein